MLHALKQFTSEYLSEKTNVKVSSLNSMEQRDTPKKTKEQKNFFTHLQLYFTENLHKSTKYCRWSLFHTKAELYYKQSCFSFVVLYRLCYRPRQVRQRPWLISGLIWVQQLCWNRAVLCFITYCSSHLDCKGCSRSWWLHLQIFPNHQKRMSLNFSLDLPF